jgi:hypothetical protein
MESGIGVATPASIPDAVRPASLLRKSILDESQRASAMAGRTATYKLRAMPGPIDSLYFTMDYSNRVEPGGGVAPNFEQIAQKLA